jgi:hypothetical protein
MSLRADIGYFQMPVVATTRHLQRTGRFKAVKWLSWIRRRVMVLLPKVAGQHH